MFLGEIIANKTVTVASASTVDFRSYEGVNLEITGTTAITSGGTPSRAGLWSLLTFAAATPLTHSSGFDLGGTDITAQAGAFALFRSTATGWKLVFYQGPGGELRAPVIDGDLALPTLGNTDGEIGGLTISAAYDQAEMQGLRDKTEELADDVRAIFTVLSAAVNALSSKNIAKDS